MGSHPHNTLPPNTSLISNSSSNSKHAQQGSDLASTEEPFYQVYASEGALILSYTSRERGIILPKVLAVKDTATEELLNLYKYNLFILSRVDFPQIILPELARTLLFVNS